MTGVYKSVVDYVTHKTKVSENQLLQDVKQQIPNDYAEQVEKHGELNWDDKSIVRFLSANHYNVAKTIKALNKHLEWRKSIAPNGKVPQEGLDAMFDQDAIFDAGIDKLGRPVGVIFASKVRPQEYSDDVVLRGGAIVLTRHAWKADQSQHSEGKHNSLFDFRGVSNANLRLSHSKVAFRMLHDHFPESNGVHFALEAPTLVWAFWNLLKPFLSEKLRRGVRFIYGEKGFQEMCEILGEEAVPEFLGGQAKLRPLKQVLIEEGFLDG